MLLLKHTLKSLSQFTCIEIKMSTETHTEVTIAVYRCRMITETHWRDSHCTYIEWVKAYTDTHWSDCFSLPVRKGCYWNTHFTCITKASFSGKSHISNGNNAYQMAQPFNMAISCRAVLQVSLAGMTTGSVLRLHVKIRLLEQNLSLCGPLNPYWCSGKFLVWHKLQLCSK